jgi:NitT/TauT family transport system permease protein
MSGQRRTTVRGLIGLVIFLVIWEALSRTHLVDPEFIPPPSSVAVQLGQLFGLQEFRADFYATLLAWFISVLVSALIAVPLGLLLGSIPGLRVATSAIIEFLRPIPPVTLVPAVIIAFGDGAQTKIIVATFTAIWPIMFNVIYGLNEVDPQLIDTAQVFRTRRARIGYAVRLPLIMPYALTGIRISAALSLIAIVSTEFLSGSGIGFGSYFFNVGEASGNITIEISGVVLAGLLGYLVNLALTSGQTKFFAWSPESRVK